MFIELTDHLRCLAPHEESFLVLLPGRMEGRSVRTGHLGCPVCGRTFELAEGILDMGAVIPEPAASALEPAALAALAGLGGPGGYFVLVGAPAGRWRELSELQPGVSLVAVNPVPGVLDEPGLSVLRAEMLPLKSKSMRGVVLGRPYADDRRWVEEAVRVVLPGLRVVGEGATDPDPALVDLMASAPGVWVGSPRR